MCTIEMSGVENSQKLSGKRNVMIEVRRTKVASDNEEDTTYAYAMHRSQHEYIQTRKVPILSDRCEVKQWRRRSIIACELLRDESSGDLKMKEPKA